MSETMVAKLIDLAERVVKLETGMGLLDQAMGQRLKPLEEDLAARRAEAAQADNRERGQLRKDLASLRDELKALKPADEAEPAADAP